MRNVSVARRYARALFELANEDGTSEKIHAALDALAKVFESSPELQTVFVDPNFSRAQRAAVLDEIAGELGVKDANFHNTLKLLNDRDRLGYLPSIARLYAQMADERAGRVRGRVVSAIELSEDWLGKLEKALEKVTQRHVVLEAKVERNVIGGVSAQVGSMVFDGTLRNQLESMRRQLKGK